MRIAISNIAWNVPAEDEAVETVLARLGVDAIDVAPGKYFPQPHEATDTEMAAVRARWNNAGVSITGMQSLLFGTVGLNLFGSADIQQQMLNHLSAICRIGAGLDARRLVFGSPKNRDRGELNDVDAAAIAIPFFRALGDIAASYGVAICLEPNPPRYGANFMTTTRDTAHIVEQVDHPAIRMQLDTGALMINGEDPEAILRDCAHLVGHVHASEPDLVTLGDSVSNLPAIAAAVRRHLPDHVVTIEMLPPREGPNVQAVERAVTTAIALFRPAHGTRESAQ